MVNAAIVATLYPMGDRPEGRPVPDADWVEAVDSWQVGTTLQNLACTRDRGLRRIGSHAEPSSREPRQLRSQLAPRATRNPISLRLGCQSRWLPRFPHPRRHPHLRPRPHPCPRPHRPSRLPPHHHPRPQALRYPRPLRPRQYRHPLSRMQRRPRPFSRKPENLRRPRQSARSVLVPWQWSDLVSP